MKISVEMERSATRRRWKRDWRELVIWIVDETECFRLDLIDKMEIRLRSTAPYIVSSSRKNACLAMEWAWGFQVTLDEIDICYLQKESVLTYFYLLIF